MAAKPLKKGATYDDLRRVPDNYVAEMFDGVFKTADSDGIGTVAGIAHDEEIAQPLIEEQLRGETAVGASQDGNLGILSLSQSLALRDVVVLRALTADESLVTGF